MFLSSSPPAPAAAFLAVPLALAALHPAGARSQEIEPAATSLAITPVTVIDVQEGVARPDRTVVIEGDRIVAAGPADSIEIPVRARVVDGTGKHLIPGLWDMHVHLFNQISGRRPNRWYFPLLVANGVTGVREMWAKAGDVSTLTEWRQRTATGELLAPRIAAAGALVDGPGSWWPSADSVATPGEGREFVRGASADGLDFVKVYSSLTREAYFAILEEAKRLGIPVAGHVPLVVRASDAAAAGQRSNEHLHQIREGCSTSEERIISERTKLYAGPFTAAQDDSLWERHERMRTNGYDAERCATLAAQLAAAGMWQVPTLVNERSYFLGPEEGAERDLRLAYLPPDERRFWREGLDSYTDIATDSHGGLDERLRRWKITKEVVSVLARGGVPFLAGTDLGIPGLYPGFSLHDELELLVEAGLTPADALRAATLEPARYLEATDSLGTVEAGKLADLVLLDANPLEDITNTRRISAVVANGRYLDRAALDQLLANAEPAANQLDAARDSVSSEDRSPAGELQSDTVHVAPPTGENETDRASILAALEEVEPGGTVLFSPGTYLIGEFLRVEVPRITLQGHPDGTTLRGCDPDDYPPYREQLGRCNGIELATGHVTVRDVTIEHAWHGIYIGCCLKDLARSFHGEGEGPPLAQPGGHLIEDNRLRSVGTAMRVIGESSEPIVIRDNVFRNTAHALVINGGTAHVLDNDIAAPEPERVPSGRHPLGAIVVFPAPPARDCGPNVIAGNRIDGHPDGIGLGVGVPGTRCERNVVRDNTIIVRRVPIGESGQMVRVGSESDSTVVGVPIGVGNVEEGLPLPPTWQFEGEAVIGEHLIEGNRVQGAEGLGIEIRRSSGNRIVGNVVTHIERRDPFPGNVANSADPEPWREANGSGIWLSPGSDGNEIVGNTFEDIAAVAVVVEGDSNRVVLASREGEVRDLGTENRVSIAESSPQRSPLVCIDEGHQERHTAGGTYALFAEWLQAEGFRVDAFTAPFKQATLKRCRVLVVANALHARNQGNWALPTPSAFTPEEIEEVHSWVRDGGGLLLIADHMPFPGAARDLGDAFGLRFSNGFAVDTAVEGRKYGLYRGSSRFVFRHRDGSLAPHSITEGLDGGASLDSVVTYTGQVFQAHGRFQPLLIAPASTISLLPQEAWQFDEETPVMDTGRWLQGAAGEFGTGRVVALGEAAQFRPDDRGEARGANAAFATNVVRWLAGLDAP